VDAAWEHVITNLQRVVDRIQRERAMTEFQGRPPGYTEPPAVTTETDVDIETGTVRYDTVNPAHYRFPGGVQVIDITRHLPFLEGNIVKYAARLGRKPGNDALQEARKIQWYANELVAFYEEKEQSGE
jgi:hypothetical protein